jgi:hypothetical protein
MKIRLFLLVATVVGLNFGTVRAQTVDDIISKHIEAIGGKAAWQKVNSVKLSGVVSAQGTDINITMMGVQNKGARMEITMMGMTGYSINTPTDGWVYMPFSGQQKPEALTPDQVKFQQDELDFQGVLVDYKSKGTTAELIGKEDVEGSECWKIKLTLKSGKVITDFFDPDSYYLIREIHKATVDGKEQSQTIDYSNFQKLPEGITFPMTMNNGNGDFVIKKTEINVPVADSLFHVSK